MLPPSPASFHHAGPGNGIGFLGGGSVEAGGSKGCPTCLSMKLVWPVAMKHVAGN